MDPTTQLWTDRYAPQTLKEICGNKGQVEKLLQWLNDWFVPCVMTQHLRQITLPRSGSLKANFKKPGKNGMNNFRGVMITGPPGIGKTTSAHLCAKLAGFTPIELNASDARSKKLVEVSQLLILTPHPWLNCSKEQYKYPQYVPRWVDGWWRGKGFPHSRALFACVLIHCSGPMRRES